MMKVRLAGVIALALVASNAACTPTWSDECALVQCEQGRCVLTESGPACACDEGHRNEAGACVPVTPCAPNPCMEPNRTACRVVDGAATCGCAPGFASDGASCAPEATWNCDVRHPGEAEEEAAPDECPLLARPLLVGAAPAARTLAPAGDEDWYRVDAPAGSVLVVTVRGTGLVPVVDVFGPDGQALVAFDHAGAAPELRLSFKLRVAGGHFLRVRAFDRSATGSYDVALAALGLDDHGDTTADATRVAPGAPLTAHLSFEDDVDVLLLPTQAQRRYRVSAVATPSTLALELVLDDADDDLGEARATGATPRLLHHARSEGLLAVRVRSANGQPVDANLTVEDLGADDHPDTPRGAALLPFDEPGTHAVFERTDDADVFAVDVRADHAYGLRCRTDDNQPCCAELVDDAGVRVPGATCVNGTVEFTAAEDRRLFLATTCFNAYPPPPRGYRVSALQRGVDELPAGPVGARDLPLGTPTTAALQTTADKDAFGFDVEAGRIYRVDCEGSSGESCTLDVSTPSASGPGVMQAGYSGFQFRASATGRGLVLVGSGTGSAFTYQLAVVALGADDHGATAFTATDVGTASTFSGAIQFRGDVDAVRFTVAHSGVHALTCAIDALSSSLLTIALHRLDGTPVPGLSVSTGNARKGLRFKADEGTAFVLVASELGVFGAFDCTVAFVGQDDTGDTPQEARPLVGWTYEGTLEFEADVDVVSFHAEAGHTYLLRAEMPHPQRGALSWSGPGPARPLSLRFSTYSGTAVATGTHYVELRGDLYDAPPLAYTLVIEDVGGDEHGNDAATATMIGTSGTPVAVSRQSETDSDWLAFPVVAGHLYRFAWSDASWVRARLYADATGLVSLDVPSRWEAPRDGVAYVEILPSGGELRQVARLSVYDLGTDDHGDDRARATALEVGRDVSGILELQADVDAFVVQLPVARVYRFHASTSVNVEIIGPQGPLGPTWSSFFDPIDLDVTTPGEYLVRVSAFEAPLSYAIGFD